MPTLKVRTKTGQITDMQVAELLEVDGKPFKSGDDYQELRDALAHLQGRMDTFENFLAATRGGATNDPGR